MAAISNPNSPLADQLRKLGLITRPQLPIATQTSIPASQNTPTLAMATPAFYMKLLDGPGILYSFTILADSNTTSNYQFLPFIGTTQNVLTGQNNQTLSFIDFPSGGSYNPVPEGTGIYLPGGTILAIYVYYNGSSATAGVLNTSITLDILGTDFDPSKSQL